MGGPPRERGGKDDSAWPEPDSTVRLLAAAVDASALGVLRSALPTTGVTTPPSPNDDFGEVAPRNDTPRTLVVSTVVRADRGTLTVMAGPLAGAAFTLTQDETLLGRDASATLVLDDPSVSRRHARITRDDGAHHVIEDLGSTNGTFVDGRRVRRAALRTGDRVQLGRDTLFRFAVVDAEEETFQRGLYEASMKDSLTELPNRRSLLERLVSEIAHVRRAGGELALLMIDIDHFKAINDGLGHLAGDEVLRAVAHIGAQAIRASDVFARFGGEEFVAMARDSGKSEAAALAERLRLAVAEVPFQAGTRTFTVTVSIGVAALSECDARDEGTGLLARADARLYVAKLSGRNRTCSDG